MVDADLRYPSLHGLFDCEAEPGLSGLLLQGRVQDLAAVEILQGTLSLMPAGPTPSNPLELVGSEQMQRFIELARERYDIVIIDTPPILAVSDALMLSPFVDGIVTVVRCGTTTRAHARRMVDQLVELTAGQTVTEEQGEYAMHKVLGMAMNFVQRQQPSSYYYYGDNAYYRESPEAQPTQELAVTSKRNGHG
ncbi:CpsD/CapB family tyrosine-protein kinase [Candidatus Entotheonella palauensis]|uniref:CpsD/CapB family tyrosine-protein kinase n=1 Tax=Candidatus Entotheonella palauensis TaxID=93172 RepID=UPI000B7D1B4F|nr:CpsD/CapB family tyrosine-protein kinase [Candidatus Entotheonella palauensis]